MIAIIDYDAGNIKSVEKALQYLGEEAVITRDREEILNSDKVILPGQEISKIVEFELTKKTIASDIPTGDISILAPAAATAAAVLSIGILTGIKVKKSRRGGNSSCGKGL